MDRVWRIKKKCMRPKKKNCDMYSNRHRLKASSPALDTFTRKNKNGRSAKAGVCMRHKHGSCVADHTCIQIDIAWTPLQVLLTHTHARTKMVGQKSQESECDQKKFDWTRLFYVLNPSNYYFWYKNMQKTIVCIFHPNHYSCNKGFKITIVCIFH